MSARELKLTQKEADGLGDGQNKVKCHVKKLLAEYEIVEDRTIIFVLNIYGSYLV